MFEQSVRGTHSPGIGNVKICDFYSVNAIDHIALELLLVGAVGGDGRLSLLDRRDVSGDLLLERIQLGDHRLCALSLQVRRN